MSAEGLSLAHDREDTRAFVPGSRGDFASRLISDVVGILGALKDAAVGRPILARTGVTVLLSTRIGISASRRLKIHSSGYSSCFGSVCE